MLGVLEKMQRSVADFLARREALRDVQVVTDRSSSLEGKFDEKLAPKVGLSVLVKRPSPQGASVSGGVISFGQVVCTVRVVENILTNPTGMSAACVAELILKNMVGFTAEGATSTWSPLVDFPWVHLVGTTTTNVVEVTLTTSMNL